MLLGKGLISIFLAMALVAVLSQILPIPNTYGDSSTPLALIPHIRNRYIYTGIKGGASWE